MFSSRVPADRGVNRLSAALAAHRTSGRPLLDLTVSNPTQVGLQYPADLLAPLADPAGQRYAPEPFGLASARQAVARDYGRRGISVAEDRIVLTASTSEAYSLLFKLLCAPEGDDVLVPVPGYPLFDHLTRLDGVHSRTYALDYHGQWEVDDHSLAAAWTPRTRGVLAVSPNNPTGSVLTRTELDAMSASCASRDAALIVDEVFADYLFDGEAAVEGDGERRVAPEPTALTFRLGGLSKSVGLPQVKLGWLAVDGPAPLVHEALGRLELICDTYLSVSTPVQAAAPALLDRGAPVREQIRDRIRVNHRALCAAAAAEPSVEVLRADGGWSAVLRIPSRHGEEDVVVRLLESSDTLVHPGFFFDFPREAYLIVSLLPEPPRFAEGIARVLEDVRG